jgi:hypothetical protein
MSHRQKTNQTMEAPEKEMYFCALSPPRQFCIRVDSIRKINLFPNQKIYFWHFGQIKLNIKLSRPQVKGNG